MPRRSPANFSNYLVLKGGAIGTEVVADDNFLPTTPNTNVSRCVNGIFEGVSSTCRGVSLARDYEILRVRPSTSAFPYRLSHRKGMELQFCGRRQRAWRTTALIGRIPALLRS